MRLSQFAGFAVFAAMLAGCAPPQKAAAPKVDPYAVTVKPDCYTVDLFTPTTATKPGADVPLEWHGFVGSWGGAAWEGRWCHDLHVLSVQADGQVDVISTHAPFPEWNREATAFRRKGRITEDGALQIRFKSVVVEYRLNGGRLYGLRREGAGEMRIKLAPMRAA